MADLPVTIDAASRDERKTEGQSDDDDTTPYSVVNFPTLSAASHTVKEAKQHLGFLAEQTSSSMNSLFEAYSWMPSPCGLNMSNDGFTGRILNSKT